MLKLRKGDGMSKAGQAEGQVKGDKIKMISRFKSSKCRFFRYNVKIHVTNQQITMRDLVRKDTHQGTKTWRAIS